MKKLKQLTIPLLAALLLGVVVPASNVYAASASFYISPSSSSVTKGNKVTVQVRINSGTDKMDTAQARINFPGSKLQYVSYSAGNFSTFTTSSGSGYFEYVGAVLGGSISGDKLLFSVTLKATSAGTAGLSLSNYQAAYSGNNLSVSASGGSVAISKPSSGGGGSSGGSSGTDGGSTGGSTFFGGTGSGQEQEEESKPPKLTSKPTFDATQSTITAKFQANKPSKATISYKPADTKGGAKTVRQKQAKKKHQVVIGQNNPLLAGTKYRLALVLISKDGKKSSKKTYTVRTKGVDYSVQVTDKQGVPLADHPVQLHSDPKKATTDEQGIATFTDVTPGKHTLVLKIDGITVRHPVKVGQPVTPAEGTPSSESAEAVQLPFSLAAQPQPDRPSPAWTTVLVSGLAGALLMFVFRLKQTRNFATFVWRRIHRMQAKHSG